MNRQRLDDIINDYFSYKVDWDKPNVYPRPSVINIAKKCYGDGYQQCEKDRAEMDHLMDQHMAVMIKAIKILGKQPDGSLHHIAEATIRLHQSFNLLRGKKENEGVGET